jgi:hypothetical protein
MTTLKRAHGDTPCRYCQTGNHKACRGVRLDETVCSCSCPKKPGRNGVELVDARRKFALGDKPCHGCSNGDHRRCKRSGCSCSCKERKIQRTLFEIPEQEV